MQLERQRENFEREGINLVALSFDSVDVLQHFAERVGIKYRLLSDPESKVIQTFEILNDTVPPTHQFHGIPHPGLYLIDEKGIVKSKFFEDKYSNRYTAGYILVREVAGDGSAPRTEQETDHLKLIASASDETVRAGNRIALVLDVELKPRMHVYAPGVKGYVPVEWTIEEASGLLSYPPGYPEPETLHLPAINETVPVYQGSFVLVADLLLGSSKELQQWVDSTGNLVVKGAFRYQACDDKICYLPQTIPLEWKFKLEAPDRTRAPEQLRRSSRP